MTGTLNQEIDEITRGFNELTVGLSEDQLNTKPSPQVWSLAQIMDHIIVINKTYEPILKGLHQGTYKPPFLSKLPFLVRFFGNVVLDSVKPDQKRKTKTFPLWEPSYSHIPKEIIEDFNAHQESLKSWMKEAQPLIEKGVVIHSPANKIIVYSLAKAFEIIVTHEKRHLKQAQALKNNILTPAHTH